MGSIAVTTGLRRAEAATAAQAGTVRVRDCPEVRDILKALDGLAEGMDKRRVKIGKVNLERGRQAVRLGRGLALPTSPPACVRIVSGGPTLRPPLPPPPR